MGLTHRLASRGVTGFNLTGTGMNCIQGASCLPRARQAAFDQAKDGGYTHLLMLDDDMVFPDDAVERLMSHEKQVVAANYYRKVPGPPTPVCMDLTGELLDSCGKSGIEEVAFVGGGILLIEMDSVKDIPPPHFCMLWDDNKKMYWGEDLFFCDRIRNAGVKIYVDHDLSRDVRHVGDYPYGI